MVDLTSIDEWHECSRVEPPVDRYVITGERLADGSWALTGTHPPGSLRYLRAAGVFWAQVPDWITDGPGPRGIVGAAKEPDSGYVN